MPRIPLILAVALVVGCKKEAADLVELEAVDLVGIPGRLDGTVVDQGGTPIANATIEMVQWPRTFGNGESVVASDVRPWILTTDSAGAFRVDPFSDEGYLADLVVPPGMTRVKVTAEGYDKTIFYKDLRYNATCDAPGFGGEAGAVVSCAEWGLDLIAEDQVDVDLLPDVIVDAATISDCRFQFDGAERRLRLSVGTPNVGRGPVDLRSTQESLVVRQQVHRKDLSVRDEILENAAFVWEGHEDHSHFHFENWTHMRLLDIDTSSELLRSNKVSFCLIDLGDYDLEIYDEVWGRNTLYNCGVSQGGGEIRQGLSPGLLDVYSRDLQGQFIEIGALSPGDYMLEVEVDPNGFIHEMDKTNNVAHVVVTIPEDEVEADYNPCQPPHLQDFGNSGGDSVDLTDRDEVSLGDDCAAGPILAAGSYWSDMGGLGDGSPLGDGEDGWFSVTVPAGDRLTVAGNLEGDLMIGFKDSCDGETLGTQDGPGYLEWEDLAWRNQGDEDATVVVVFDNFSQMGTAGNVIFDVSLD